MGGFRERLQSVIPGGAHTYSRGADQFPLNAPEIVTHGRGPWLFDAKGLKYLDYGMGLRSVSLGYSYKSVNQAAKRAINRGNTLTLPHTLELEAAERIIDSVPGADMVKFAKNGSNATTAAVKLARAFTGRAKILVPDNQPFFSFDDWFIGATALTRGIPPSGIGETLRFRYNDLAHLDDLFHAHSGQIACVIMEPLTSTTPCSDHGTESEWQSRRGPCAACVAEGNNFLSHVRSICDKYGALLIMDEMITGFRWSQSGASRDFGVEPDLTTFGKAISNGFSLAFVAGREEVMRLGDIQPEGMERTFLLSSTHGAEMTSLAAFLQVASVYEKKGVIDHLWEFGRALRSVITAAINEARLSELIVLRGPDCLLTMEFMGDDTERSALARTLFLQEMVSNGVLMPWIAPSLSHGDVELKQTARALERSLPVVAHAYSTDDFSALRGPAARPVFRKFN